MGAADLGYGDDWPSADVLEKWLMEATAESDARTDHSKMLRKILHTNPGYGSTLIGDKELCALVIDAAKNLKTTVLSTDGPVSTVDIYHNLCQFLWCAVGQVLHSISALGEKTGHPLALSKKARGQLRFLLKTNEDLSDRLNAARRAYLLELSEHRSRQQRIRPACERALAAATEQPVMFYEPLDYVLDESTKAFVREVVMERLRLEMSAESLQSQEAEEAEMLRAKLHQQSHQLAEAERDMQEMRKLNTEADLALRRAQRAALESEQKAAAAQKVGGGSAREEELQQDLTTAMQKIAELETALRLGGSAQQESSAAVRDASQPAPSSSDQALEAEIKRLKAQCNDLTADLEKAWKENMELLQRSQDQVPASELQVEIERHVQAEVGLLKANQALEKALEDLQMDHSDTELHRSDVDESAKALEGEVSRLHAEMEKACLANQMLLQAKDGGDAKQLSEALGLLKHCANYEDLEEKNEELVSSCAKLERKGHFLLKKLQESCGEEVAKETLTELSLEEPVLKGGKRKAMQSLFNDSQRRLLEVKIKTESLKAEQARALKVLSTHAARTRTTDSEMEGIFRLQSAFEAISQRFSDAVQRLYARHVPSLSEEGRDRRTGGAQRLSPAGPQPLEFTAFSEHEREAVHSTQYDFEDAVASASTPKHLAVDRLSNASQDGPRMPPSPLSAGKTGSGASARMHHSGSKWRASRERTPGGGAGPRGGSGGDHGIAEPLRRTHMFRAASSHSLQAPAGEDMVQAMQRTMSRSYGGQEGFYRAPSKGHDGKREALAAAGRLAVS